MGISPLVFTGVSKFSDDFQTILNRTVAIANIPLLGMQNQQTDLLAKKQVLSDLRTGVASLSSALSSLGQTAENKALSVASSNSGRVSASLNGATTAGTYTISNITSVAKAASETTLTGIATANSTEVSSDGVMQLVVGSTTYAIDLTGDGKNNLNGLRDAINALGAGVSASVLNTGTGDSPYYLSITANSAGQKALELREIDDDTGSNILSADNQGSNAIFKLNGLDVETSDNVINDVVLGVTFTIVSTTTGEETVSLKLASNRSVLANDLQNIVSKYNAVRLQVNAQIGEAAGLLSGDFIVREVQNNLRMMSSYQGSGSVQRLADLGLEFSQTGEMTFNSDKFYSLSDAEITSGFDYIGSATTGLGEFSTRFDQISNPISGLIKLQQDQYDVADDRISTQMAELASRVEYMQAGLSVRLQQADVLLAQLESQQTTIEASLKGLSLTLYGRNE